MPRSVELVGASRWLTVLLTSALVVVLLAAKASAHDQ